MATRICTRRRPWTIDPQEYPPLLPFRLWRRWRWLRRQITRRIGVRRIVCMMRTRIGLQIERGIGGQHCSLVGRTEADSKPTCVDFRLFLSTILTRSFVFCPCYSHYRRSIPVGSIRFCVTFRPRDEDVGETRHCPLPTQLAQSGPADTVVPSRIHLRADVLPDPNSIPQRVRVECTIYLEHHTFTQRIRDCPLGS